MKLQPSRSAGKRKSVTVVIPCYNYGHFLAAAVDSVLSQDRVDAQVIIVDDASPDGSVEVARRLAAQDSRISVVAHEVNQGHITTYQDGLARVDTEYVALLSADDLLAPGALERAIDLMEAHPGVGMVYGLPAEFESEAGPPPPKPGRRSSWIIWSGHEWLTIACVRGRGFILSPEVVMRTAALRQVGEYNIALPHSGDLEYWVRTAARWDIGRVNGPVHAYYRVHGQNMHLTSFATIQLDLEHRLEAFRVLESGSLDDALPRARRLFQLAKQGISREALILATRNLDSGGAPDYSAQLLELAVTTHPRSARMPRGRLVARRVRRALAGARPTDIHRFAERARTQLDRVRWTFWRIVGIS